MKVAQKRTKSKNSRLEGASAKSKGRKIIVEFPPELYSATEKAMARLSMNRSNLIREALGEYLAKLTRDDLEQQLAEGYVANSQQALETAKSFEHVDLESD